MESLKIVHLALTPVAGSPWNIVQATNLYTKCAARIIVYDPVSYGGRIFQNDIDWMADKKQAIEALKEADIVHLHQWFEPKDWFGSEVGKICESKILVRQFHSAPELFTGGDSLIMEAIEKDPIPHLVIAQFQERFYPQARIVPNIIPINSTPYLPLKAGLENSIPIVAWSPSSRNSLFSSRWETKGYRETLTILRRLESEGVCRLDLVENIPHEEALNRKRMADLVFDEVVTGSYHLSGLEGLSMGKPVIGWLDERTQFVLRRITGANMLPWVNVHLEDVEKTLRNLLEDKNALCELGAESRAWMSKWYDDRILINHYIEVYKDLVERPAIFSEGFKDNFLGTWRKIHLPNMIWESKRKRMALSFLRDALKKAMDKGVRVNTENLKNSMYELAISFLKPGDRVLDISPNAVFKGYMSELKNATPLICCETFDMGGDSNSQINIFDRKKSLLPFQNNSFEVITLFLDDLNASNLSGSLLKEAFDLLVPGGRLIFSVNNLMVARGKIEAELPLGFIPECCYVGAANQLAPIIFNDESNVDLNSLLDKGNHSLVATFMKSPLENDFPYQERVLSHLLTSGHPSIDHVKNFQNPWLVYALHNVSYRLKNPTALRRLADKALEIYPPKSNDYAAALCVKGYLLLNEGLKYSRDNDKFLSEIKSFVDLPFDNLMALRWRVSLQFLAGKINQALGRFADAKKNFIACFSNDISKFGIHLATKTTEAIFTAGKLAYEAGNLSESKKLWKEGISYGEKLLQVNLGDILINQDYPNRFNYGDGVREYTLAWDNIAKCANGINLLQSGLDANTSFLNSSFSFENEVLNKDLVENRQELTARTKLLEQTIDALDTANAELNTRTHELVENRQELTARTKLLEQTIDALDTANAELNTRTHELVENRQELTARTKLLEQTIDALDTANAELNTRTHELVENRQELTARTKLLEQTIDALGTANAELNTRTHELVENRQELTARTKLLEQTIDALGTANAELNTRTHELVELLAAIRSRNVYKLYKIFKKLMAKYDHKT